MIRISTLVLFFLDLDFNASTKSPTSSNTPTVNDGIPINWIPPEGIGSKNIAFIPVFNAATKDSDSFSVLVKIVIDEYKLFSCLTKLFRFLINSCILAELGQSKD
jgi:hypothetical protein